MERKLVISSDGSHTIFIPELNETYHSLHGALQESVYVFIDKGLKALEGRKKIKLLEVGFGTGLNALLTLKYTQDTALDISYHTLEPFPLSMDLVAGLNYSQFPELGLYEHEFKQMHILEFDTSHSLSANFTFTKYQQRLEDYQANISFDIIFYDAFAPSKQAELWNVDCMRKCFDYLKPEGLLVSYCASGEFKRNLKAVGFIVETLPGPPGKKEMTRGFKV